jgi:macrolide-specific efflux system membrane fusion protein
MTAISEEPAVVPDVQTSAPTVRQKNVVLRHKKLATALVLVLVGTGSGAWALSRSGAPAAVTRSITSTVSAGTLEQTVSASGTIEAADVADLTFPVSGTVTRVKATVGETVKKGQVLAKIDTADLKRAVEVAVANRDAAQAQVDAASGSDTQIAAANAQLATAKDKLAAARDDLASATMVSPISGTVASVDIVVGDVLGGGGGQSGGSGSSGSSSQITVVGTSAYVVNAAVSGSDLSNIKAGQQARITPSGATQPVFGTVSSVGVIAASSSGGSATFPVTIKVTGTPAGLHPGGSATVVIVTKSLPDVLTVPTAALRQENGKTVVAKIVGSGTQTVEVTVGESYGANTQVLSGLSDGDQVQVTTITRPAGAPNTRNGGAGTRGTFGGFTGGAGPVGGFSGTFPAGGNFGGNR